MEPEPTSHEVPYLRAIPVPTSGPLIAAFGVSLLFAGLVTSYAVSAVGVLCAIWGAVQWFGDCFPHEDLEELPEGCEYSVSLGGAGEQAAPAHGVRQVMPAEVHEYRAGVRGGVVGGIAMAVVACGWGVLQHGSVWIPINLLAGIVTPTVEAASIEQLDRFDAAWVMLALLVHGGLSVSAGLLYSVSLPMWPNRPMLLGGLLMPAMMSGLAWGTMGLVNPALEQHVSWPYFVASQVAFGVACGALVARGTRVPASAPFNLAERLRVERSETGERL